MSETTAKETKAQKAERLKREKNPWQSMDEIRAFARNGWASIPPEWLNTYFKWWGVYTQGDGVGAIGGVGGEGKKTEHFMVRVGIPNGILTSSQLKDLANLADRHARGGADISVRQNLQFHWVTIEGLPDLLDSLWAIGFRPIGACGDVVRNVTGCPLAGVAHDEICDASSIALEASRRLSGNDQFYNLPRKFKCSVTGCRVWCSYPEINDIGLTAIERQLGGKSEIGFSVRVGGGLSSDPHLAVRLNAFVRWEQAIAVMLGITDLFREQEGLRENRERARLKHLFLKHGWTAESFLSALEEKIGFNLDPAVPEIPPDDVYRDHVGVHPQKQAGLYYVGASVMTGRLTSDQMRAAAALSERYADGKVRTTIMQNLLIVNVPERNTYPLVDELNAAGLRVEATSFWRGAIACTGTEFCKLAITETKGFIRWLVEEIEERVPSFDQQLKLHVTGCPNSCGQHWIADVGLEGKKIKVDGKLVDAYYFCVGGAVGKHQQIARPVGYRCPASDVPDALARLLSGYMAERRGGENLRQFFTRTSDTDLRMLLAGEEIVAVGRDPSPGRPPAAVSG
ncbi:MAG TPA: nitrite/sulfite reductase [Terriglobales bacterium]|nr:nitrite/sulfite reductase [Terriglobales bacterium]